VTGLRWWMALVILSQIALPISRAAAPQQASDAQSLERAQQNIEYVALHEWLMPVVDALEKGSANDPNLRAYLAQITVSADPWTLEQGNAYSDRRHGARVVVETNLLSWIWCLSELDIMEHGPWPYTPQVTEWWRLYGTELGTSLAAHQGLPMAVLPLEKYVPDPVHREFMEEYTRQENEPAIAFVVLHEIAHHVLGHLNRNPRNNEESRQWELAADSWAFQKMRELKYPLRGVYDFLLQWARFETVLVPILDGQTGAASPAQLAELESKSDHPLWRTRAANLAEHFDVNEQPDFPFRFFIAMDTKHFPDGHKELFKVLVVFPNPELAAKWGRGLVIFGDKDTVSVWTEYKDGEAFIYGVNGHLKLEMKTPDKLWSAIDFDIVNSTGVKQTMHLVGWYDSFAKYFPDPGVEGLTSLETLKYSNPADITALLLKGLPWDAATKQIVINSSTACSLKLSGILLPYYKGQMRLTEDERVAIYSKNVEECQAELKAKLGEERFKILQAAIMDNKLFQDAFDYTMKGHFK